VQVEKAATGGRNEGRKAGAEESGQKKAEAKDLGGKRKPSECFGRAFRATWQRNWQRTPKRPVFP